jgi:hypothetical protein
MPTYMKKIIRTFGFLALLGLAHLASAQTMFTVTATANSTTNNYTSGNSYTFVFTLGSGSTFSGAYTSDRTSFQDETTASDSLWSSVGGTGLLGSYVRAVGDPGDPFNIAAAELPPNYTNQSLYLVAGTEQNVTQTIGVTTLSGTNLSWIEVSIDDSALPSWTMAISGTAPASYFSGYTGTYTGLTGANADTVKLYNASGGGLILDFNVTSVAISAVPEPSTYAAAFGLAALIFAGWRRRKLAA